MPKGQVKNHSSKTLWVVENDSGPAVAHKLAPKKKSPSGTDADGFKAVDGTPVDGHRSWVKIIDLSTADVADKSDGTLARGCYLCKDVQENEFGPVRYDSAEGWGEPL
jgi:hypothetical protein